MDIAFKGIDLVRFGIILYVVVWLAFFCYVNIYSRRKNQNVHKVAMWSSITVATRWLGWLPGLCVSLLLFFVLPDVHVVTQNFQRKKAEMEESRWSWNSKPTYTIKETFYVDKYYVPFRYHGNSCKAFGSYLFNETDSTLVVYSTALFNGMFTRVSNVDEFEEILPGQFLSYNHVDNEFDSPVESSLTYIPESRKNKSVTELTLTLKSDAFYDTERIRMKIRERNAMIYGWDEKDSLGIPIKEREFVLKQLRESKDVKQGTH